MAESAGRSGVVEIRPAEWPQELPAALSLLEEYFATLRENPRVPAIIRQKDRGPELQALGTSYRDDAAMLLLAWADGEACGCAAVRVLPDLQNAAELKRLYIRPGARGRGAGRALVGASVTWARSRGARRLLLDTLPAAMPEAVALYRSLGFVATERYNSNTGPEFAFYEKDLG